MSDWAKKSSWILSTSVFFCSAFWDPWSQGDHIQKLKNFLFDPPLWDKLNHWFINRGQCVLYFLSRLLDMNGQEVKMIYAIEWFPFYSLIYNNQSFRNVKFFLCWSQMSLKFDWLQSCITEPLFARLFGEHEKFSQLRKKIKRLDDSGGDWRVGIGWEGHVKTPWNGGRPERS